VAVLVLGACSVSSSKSTSGGPASGGPASGGVSGPDYAAKFANDPVQGLTDKTIKVGFAAIDYEAIKKQYGVDLGNGGNPMPDEVIPALVKAVNDSGGINGRTLEVSVRKFLPVGSDSSEQSCRQLAEDDKVFAVVGTYLADNALCVTETHKIPYFSGWGLNAERQSRSNAPYVITGNTDEQRAVAAVHKVVEAGVLKGKKVAVYWTSETPDQVVNDDVIGTLKKGGVDVVSSAKQPDTTDQVQSGNDIDRILQRFKTDGADTVVFWSGMGVVIPALQRSTWHPQIVFTNGQANGDLSSFGLKDPKVLDGAVAVMNSVPSDIMEKDPGFLACLKTINDNSDLHLVPTDIESPKERPGSVGASFVPQACQMFDLMVDVLKAAGSNPSSASIVKGLAQLKSFSLPAISDASLGPDKWYTGMDEHLWHFDVSKARFVRDDEPGAS
jgi:hypothetical protein